MRRGNILRREYYTFGAFFLPVVFAFTSNVTRLPFVLISLALITIVLRRREALRKPVWRAHEYAMGAFIFIYIFSSFFSENYYSSIVASMSLLLASFFYIIFRITLANWYRTSFVPAASVVAILSSLMLFIGLIYAPNYHGRAPIFSERNESQVRALEVFKNNIIVGVGIGNMRDVAPAYATHPTGKVVAAPGTAFHVLAEAGLMGFVAFIAALWYLLSYIYSKYNRYDIVAGAGIFILCVGFNILTQLSVLFLVALLLGLLVANEEQHGSVYKKASQRFLLIFLLFISLPVLIIWRGERFAAKAAQFAEVDDLANAVVYYEEANQYLIKDPDVVAAQAWTEFLLGSPENALELYDTAIAINSSSTNYYSDQAFVLRFNGAPDKAELSYAKSIQKDPFTNLGAYEEYARTLISQSKYEEARHILNSIIATWGEYSEFSEFTNEDRDIGLLFYERARAGLALGDTVAAADDLRQTLRLYPGFQPAQDLLNSIEK